MEARKDCKELALGDIRHELVLTRRVLERIPEEHWDWKPHERSFSLGELAIHITNLPLWQESMLREEELDFAEASTDDEIPRNRDAILAWFDSRCEAVRQSLDELHDDDLETEYVLRNGRQVVLELPRHGALRTLGISHLIHHRAQLMVYLRLLDVPLPAVYGPTADEVAEID
jgi:uncharacterized damage-inducible protein DinB